MGALLCVIGLALCAFIALAVCAIRYYMGPYARVTKRDFLPTLRDPRAWACNQVAARLAKTYGKDCRMLFDVALPCGDASAASVDAVLLTPRGIVVLCVQGGRGKVYGGVDDDQWVAVQADDNDSAVMIPNLGVNAQMATFAIKDYLMLESKVESAIVPLVVLGGRLRDDGVDVPDGVLVTRGQKVAQTLEAKLAGPEQDIFDADQLKRMHRALKACAGALPGVGVSIADGSGAPEASATATKPDPTSWVRSVVQRGRDESTSAELVRKADRLASSKEDFDALTWDRILEISADLDRERDPERVAELAAELRLIARTNVSLNYRFGIAQAPEGAALSPAGLVVESSVGELTGTEPDPELREALEAAEEEGFFDNQLDDGSDTPAMGEDACSSQVS